MIFASKFRQCPELVKHFSERKLKTVLTELKKAGGLPDKGQADAVAIGHFIHAIYASGSFAEISNASSNIVKPQTWVTNSASVDKYANIEATGWTTRLIYFEFFIAFLLTNPDLIKEIKEIYISTKRGYVKVIETNDNSFTFWDQSQGDLWWSEENTTFDSCNVLTRKMLTMMVEHIELHRRARGDISEIEDTGE